MTVENLYNLDKPDEQADLNLKDASREEIIAGTYKVWQNVRKSFMEENKDAIRWDERSEPLYREACRILSGFKDRFAGIMTKEDIGPVSKAVQEMMRKKLFGSEWKDASYSGDGMYNLGSGGKGSSDDHSDAGLYLTALLNKTNLKILHLNDIGARVCGAGYRLAEGKTIILDEDSRIDCTGECAQGGTIINFGKVSKTMGQYANGGIHINLGKISAYHDGVSHVRGGIFINFDDSVSVQHDSIEGGTFVGFERRRTERFPYNRRPSECFWVDKKDLREEKTKNATTEFFIEHLAKSQGIPKHELEKELKKDDSVIIRLLDKLEGRCLLLSSGAWEKNYESIINDVNQLARKVDEEVQKDYETRWSSWL